MVKAQTASPTKEIPIFPLPNSILYPGVYVPFHIFEDRYKQMLQFVQDNKTDLAVSFAPELKPGQYFPSMICGAGLVRTVKRYENGEADILVFGTHRVKINRYIQEVPFLIGEAEILQMDREMPTKTENELLTQVRDMLISWIFTNFDDAARPIQFFKNVSDLEPLCNFVAFYFLNDMEKKQKLLEENSLEAKAQAIWQVLKDLQDSGESGPKGAGALIFPGSSGSGDEGSSIN